MNKNNLDRSLTTEEHIIIDLTLGGFNRLHSRKILRK